MSSLKHFGSIRVVCSDETGPIKDCIVTLSDSNDRVLMCSRTDCSGRAELKIECAGEYWVRAESRCRSPHAQNRQFHLCPDRSYECQFLFQRPLFPC